MTLRVSLPLALLALQAPLLGQDTVLWLRQGDDALASGLWEVAAHHFDQCLARKNLGAAEKSTVALRLAEAWVRGGRAKEALDLLGRSFVPKSPESTFWRGQALLVLGRFAEAAETLAPLADNPEFPHHAEAVFTYANLQLALGAPDLALASLDKLADSPQSVKARLRQVEILLDQGESAEARRRMPAGESVGESEKPLAAFLDARLLLEEGRAADAAAAFQNLVDQPTSLGSRRYHAAAVGLADALAATRATDAAAGFLLSFIQEHPDSPQLAAMFDRLLDLLPQKPTANDPILDRLSQWIPPSNLAAPGLIASLNSGALAPYQEIDAGGTVDELPAYALFARAMGLQRLATPLAAAEAKRLFTRLRVEYPTHPLASRSLFEIAKRALENDQADQALGLLETLRESPGASHFAGEAAFLEARTAYQRGDKELAVRLFEEAAKHLAAENSKTARLNAELIRLTESPVRTVQTQRPVDESLAADLELERALSLPDPVARRAAIEEFLTKRAGHPRIPEARLAAAEAALTGPTPDLSFARAQLDTLAADPDAAAGLSETRIAMVNLRIADLANDSAAATAIARAILEKHAGQPAAAEAALVLGRNLFQSRSYNDARLVLEGLAATDTDPGRAQAAWLLAARSAALVPTSQSQQEALILFDKAIGLKGPLSAIGRLEKARLLIDMNRLAEAAAFLKAWFDALPATDPLHLPAGLLLGEATYAAGGSRPASLAEALAVYDKLLVHAEKQPALYNRLQYLRGLTLEQMPDPKDPSKKREREAFIAYYSVLETDTPPAEWEYFESCGFKALKLLENAGRWPAAIACAKKIASFNGPGAKKAADYASQLQLKHMIWED